MSSVGVSSVIFSLLGVVDQVSIRHIYFQGPAPWMTVALGQRGYLPGHHLHDSHQLVIQNIQAQLFFLSMTVLMR